MRLTAIAAATIGLVIAAFAASTASAQERIDYGPFYVLQSDPTSLYLDGFLAPSSAQALYDALKDVQPTTLVLSSTGGSAIDAMVVAELVANNRINTIVPEDASCTSVCFFVAMAGWERTINGTLSMHRWVDPNTQNYMTTEEMNAIEERDERDRGAGACALRRLG